jgi:hypothetical protein
MTEQAILPLRGKLASAIILSVPLLFNTPCYSQPLVANEDNIELLLEFNPSDIELLFMYSIILQNRREFNKSREVLEKISELGSSNILHVLELAKLQYYSHDYELAKENFLKVYRQSIPTNFRLSIRNYLRRIEEKQPSKFGYDFKISYNDNINNGTYSDTVTLFGVPFKVDESAKARGSYEFYSHFYANHTIRSKDFDFNLGGRIEISDFVTKTHDRLRYAVHFGPEKIIKNQKFNLDLTFSKNEIGYEEILNSTGVSLSHSYNFSPRSMLRTQIRSNRQRYYENAPYNAENLSANFTYYFLSKSAINYSFGIGFSDRDAQYKPYGFKKNIYSASIGTRLPLDFYADLSFLHERSTYKAFELIWLKRREDRARVLQLNIRNERVFFKNLVPQLNFTLRDNDSNVDVFKTNSDSISVFLTKEF